MSRTHRTRKFVGAALLAASATPTQALIFDRDDRQYVSAGEGSAYASVGLVTQGLILQYFTTGFLVDDCHVLTSQIALGYGQAPLGKRLKFQTAIGTPQHQTVRGTVVAAGGLKRHKTIEERYADRPRGWLLLRLDRCIGASLGHVTLKTGPFSPYEFSDLKSVGYPVRRDRKKGLTLDPSCRVLGGRGPIWVNDCATVKGDAGDPIFRLSATGGEPHMEVYAMQTYAFTSGQAIAGRENQAVSMASIAPQIEPYLSMKSRQGASDQGATNPKRSDALSRIGGSAGAPSYGSLLGTGLVTADQRPSSDRSVQ